MPAGHPITSENLEAAEARQGVRLESGDALVVRCGWSASSTRRSRCRASAWTWCGGCAGAGCPGTPVTSATRIRRLTPPCPDHCTASRCPCWACPCST
ncbi:cyclase family protein [Streptomyces sp. NPDC008125]|uniref:cyclase family protein n=1 Tax=Streptomyces sp. NPDC008125 TaxID=3364811 RepID=UPI0036E93515